MTETVAGAPATIASGTRVIIVVSRGPAAALPESVPVPNVSAMSQGHAVAALQRAGFNARVVHDYSDRVGAGRTTGQFPQPGSMAAHGSEVFALASSGPAPADLHVVVLPEVVGMHESEAVHVLETAGLSPVIGYEHSPMVPDGVVIAQMPDRQWLAAANAHRPRTPWWMWPLLAAFLIAATMLVLAVLMRPGEVTVPDVVGQLQTEAVQRLDAAGLVGRVVTEAPLQVGLEPGEVVTQTPAAGARVMEGSAVELTVVGPAAVQSVPDVVGMSAAAARSALEQAGYEVRVTDRETEDAEADRVLAQRPPPGTTLAAGGAVAITVAREPAGGTVTVPDVEGLIRTSAESELQRLRLRVQVIENPSTQVAEGVVIQQFPAEQTDVAAGTTVGIVVSSGPPQVIGTVSVSDVVGELLPDAQETLRDAGLRSLPVAVEGSGEPVNTVLAQLPPADDAVSESSSVLLFYSAGE